MDDTNSVLLDIVQYLDHLLGIILGAGLFICIVVSSYWYVIDKRQIKSALRRNYPVIARFRYLFEHLGEFFRQYFFAMDREEMPFNRAERSWCYRAAKDVDSTVCFGSTRSLRPAGTVYFVNCSFPTLQSEADHPMEITIGPYCPTPYVTSSIFNISAMSYGALSKVAVQALSKGAKQAGIWMNTGEGGLTSYHLEGGADLVFQIGTAKFGVRDTDGKLDDKKLKEIASHKQVKMFEIKLSQGAKPGKGGILPAEKVTEEIATIRGITKGQDALSPNRHLEVNSISDLIDMIEHIRHVTHKPVGFKCVVGQYDFFENLCKEINKRGIKSAPDFITIDSSDGGTGAAPMSLMDNVGMPIKESLPQVVDILTKNHLRDRIKICASGKLITPVEVAWALCAGADFVMSARGFMFALGCIQALRCNKNTCPTGIATHNKSLQSGLIPIEKAVRVAQYANCIHKEVRMISHSCGVKKPRDLRRTHARIALGNGKSISMSEMYK